MALYNIVFPGDISDYTYFKFMLHPLAVPLRVFMGVGVFIVFVIYAKLTVMAYFNFDAITINKQYIIHRSFKTFSLKTDELRNVKFVEKESIIIESNEGKSHSINLWLLKGGVKNSDVILEFFENQKPKFL